MDGKTLDYLMRKAETRRDYRNSRDYRRGSGRGVVDFEGSMDFADTSKNERHDYRYSDSRRDYYDSRDARDYHDAPRLSKADMHRWKQMMENEDGSRGPHYDMQQIVAASEKAGVHFEDFDEREFCIAVNMMYSDYCKVAKKFVAPDKELHFYVDLAKAFLEDEDGPEPSEKLALYFHCIVDA